MQHWEEALWLARCRLEDSEYSDMANKYAEHLLTQGMSTHSYNQGCGNGSSGSAWIRIKVKIFKGFIRGPKWSLGGYRYVDQ